MNLLVVADIACQRALADALIPDFEIARASTVPEALALAARQPFDAALVHLDLGEHEVLDLMCECRRQREERVPGFVVLAREVGRRAIVELVRTGAYDVLPEESLQPHELAHALRNAAHFARSVASLDRRRARRSREVFLVGENEGASSIIALLQAAGFAVRQADRALPAAAESDPRAIVVDLATVRDGQALLRLLSAGGGRPFAR